MVAASVLSHGYKLPLGYFLDNSHHGYLNYYCIKPCLALSIEPELLEAANTKLLNIEVVIAVKYL